MSDKTKGVEIVGLFKMNRNPTRLLIALDKVHLGSRLIGYYGIRLDHVINLDTNTNFEDIRNYTTVYDVSDVTPLDGLDDQSFTLSFNSFALRRRRLHENLGSLATRLQNRMERSSNLAESRKHRADFELITMLRNLLFYTNANWRWLAVAESDTDPRKVSYAPEKNYIFNKKRRRVSSWAKFFKWAMLNDQDFGYTDSQIERITYLIGTEFPENYNWEFEVVHGEPVMDMFKSGNTDAPSSCMVGKEFPILYVDNPDKVGMVKIKLGNVLRGRALIWNTDEGRILLDRIYPSDGGSHIEAAINWARNNGYDWKPIQKYRTPTAESAIYSVTVKLRRSVIDFGYPYLDTFAYTDSDLRQLYDSDVKEATIVLHNDLKKRGRWLFNTTNGTPKESKVCLHTNKILEPSEDRIFEVIDQEGNLIGHIGTEGMQSGHFVIVDCVIGDPRDMDDRHIYGYMSVSETFTDSFNGSAYPLSGKIEDYKGRPIYKHFSSKDRDGAVYHRSDYDVKELNGVFIAPPNWTEKDTEELKRLERIRAERIENFDNWARENARRCLNPMDYALEDWIVDWIKNNYSSDMTEKMYKDAERHMERFVTGWSNHLREQMHYYMASNDRYSLRELIPQIRDYMQRNPDYNMGFKAAIPADRLVKAVDEIKSGVEKVYINTAAPGKPDRYRRLIVVLSNVAVIDYSDALTEEDQ